MCALADLPLHRGLLDWAPLMRPTFPAMGGPIVNDNGVGLMAEIKLTQFAKCGASNLI